MIAQTKSHQSFPQFDKLPFELRSLIWLFAARIPRDIEITQYAHCSTPALLYPCRESHAHCSDITTKIAGRTPALLHTCRESRAKALDIYDKFGLEYRKSVLRKPVLRRKVIIYFNPCTDVIYFKSEPHFNHIEPFRPLPTTISPHIRYMKLDTRWIRDTQTDLDQIGFIQSLFEDVWKFSKIESLELIVHDDDINIDMVQSALERLVQTIKPVINWQLVQVSQRRYIKGSETCSASTTHHK
jgi:hypothetical protein